MKRHARADADTQPVPTTRRTSSRQRLTATWTTGAAATYLSEITSPHMYDRISSPDPRGAPWATAIPTLFLGFLRAGSSRYLTQVLMFKLLC
jgi:hypothetical protein